jgi:hypothetical protein
MKITSRVMCVLTVVTLSLSCVRGQSDKEKHPKPTRFQREATGLWRVTPFSEKALVKWVSILPAETPDQMMTIWPLGMGCGEFGARIQGKQIIPLVGNVQFLVQIDDAKSATLRSLDGKTVLPLKKTKEDPHVLCE